jgi:hypothetical protein
MFRPRPGLIQLLAFGLAVAILGGLAVFVWMRSNDKLHFFEILEEADNRWAMPTPSPDLKQFFERSAQVRLEMGEADIDRIFADSIGGWSDSPDKLATARQLKRPTVLVKWYYSIPNSTHWKYFIRVYFDENRRVVGKSIGWASE